MDTEKILRLLIENNKDGTAALTLKRHAIREGDTFLLEFLEESAKARLNELRLESTLWEKVRTYAGLTYAGLTGSGPALVLTLQGPKKIQVIKEVRTITGLGLKESKLIVDTIPSVVVANVHEPKQAAAAIEILAGIGAVALWDDLDFLGTRFPTLNLNCGADVVSEDRWETFVFPRTNVGKK